MVNVTYDKKVLNKKYLAYSLILSFSLILIGISLSSVRRKQKPSLFFIKICIGKILPKIADLPKESSALQGTRHNITCSAESCYGDKTRYQWLDPLQRDLSKLRGFTVKGGLLTISDVQKSAEGEYKCKVVDDYGADEATVRLKVQVPPRIIRFGNLTREENSMATFECKAEGVPKPNVTIRRDKADGLVRSGDSRVRLVQYDEGDMRVLQVTIVGVKRSDDGLYLCQASNAAGLVVEAGSLEVQFKPDMSPTPTSVVKAWSANPRNLTCIAAANPSASLTWKFRGVQIDQWGERYQIFGSQSKSSLQVRTDDFEVFGEYTCEAENRLGKNSMVITLEKAFVPGPVPEIIFHRVTPTTITFKFLHPVYTGGLPITSYIMRYKALTDYEERSVNWIEGTTYILTNLKPRTMYRFSLAARNAVGEGPRLTERYITPAEKAPDAPQLVKESPSIHPDRVTLRWEVPNCNGEPVTRYQVRYFRADSCRQPSGEAGHQQVGEGTPESGEYRPKSGQRVFERTVQSPEIELSGLRPDTCYAVEVKAVNKIGKSPSGRAVLRTSKLLEGYLVRREDLDSTVCGMALFILLGFGFLLYRVVSPVSCSRWLMRSKEESKAFVISSREEKPKNGLFRV